MDTGHPQGHRLGTKNQWGNSHTRDKWGCLRAGNDSPRREEEGHRIKMSFPGSFKLQPPWRESPLPWVLVGIGFNTLNSK